MLPNDTLIYLGVLAAPTASGPQAAAVALSGAVDLYHLADADLDTENEMVRDWLWRAGINPDAAAQTAPNKFLIEEVLLPAIDHRALVVHHADLKIPLVYDLVVALSDLGNAAIISGVEMGPVISFVHGIAPRRAIALQNQYEAALNKARVVPALHTISGNADAHGRIVEISVTGPFAQQTWSLPTEESAFFLMAHFSHMTPLATFVVSECSARNELQRLAKEMGLAGKLAA